MHTQPTLRTQRLLLRAFAATDVPDVHRMAGAREIAATTLRIRHPYTREMAEEWIGALPALFAQGHAAVFAVTLVESGSLLGAVGLDISPEHARAELGFWIGSDYWNSGYATEAGREILEYGFRVLGLNRICAHHFVGNEASGRVLLKLGMTREGTLRQHVRKWEQFVDVECYAILVADFQAGRVSYGSMMPSRMA